MKWQDESKTIAKSPTIDFGARKALSGMRQDEYFNHFYSSGILPPNSEEFAFFSDNDNPGATVEGRIDNSYASAAQIYTYLDSPEGGQLFGGGTKKIGTYLKVPGEGQWAIVDDQVMFLPEPGFTGTPSPVDYRVIDTEAINTLGLSEMKSDEFPDAFAKLSADEKVLLKSSLWHYGRLYFEPEFAPPDTDLPDPKPVEPTDDAKDVYQPEYTQISVEQGQTGKVAVPGGTYPTKSTKFTKTGNTPAWATVNEDGSIDVAPGKDVTPQVHQIPVLVTYSDGSSETVNAPVNVTKSSTHAQDYNPEYEPTSVVASKTATVPTPLHNGKDKLPEGTKFTQSGKGQDWYKVNPDGTITLTTKPTTHPGLYEIPVLVTLSLIHI